MKQCLFLILLMIAPGFALANETDSDLGKAAPMHASAEPAIMVRQKPEHHLPAKRKVASASVKTQPMVIKLKPHKKYATIQRNKKKPTMAMRPIYPPRRVVANAPATPVKKKSSRQLAPHKYKIAATSVKHAEKKRTPSGKASKPGFQKKVHTNKVGKTKIARADS